MCSTPSVYSSKTRHYCGCKTGRGFRKSDGIVQACCLWCGTLKGTLAVLWAVGRLTLAGCELSLEFLGVYGSIEFRSLHLSVSPDLWLINSVFSFLQLCAVLL